MLDLSSLRRAVNALAAVVAKSEEQPFMSQLDEVARSAIQAGVIQHFEFTYELSWKFMKRWLETNLTPAAADGVTRRELFRLAVENRLIDDIEAWMRHHAARNLVSRTYVPEIAAQVFAAAGEFLHHAGYLLNGPQFSRGHRRGGNAFARLPRRGGQRLRGDSSRRARSSTGVARGWDAIDGIACGSDRL